MTKFEGTFTNFKNEKLDEFYSAIGIPWVARKMMTASSPTIEISKKDDQWTMKTSTLMSSSSNTFKLGEEYEETMMGGRSIKNTATVEDNKLIISSQSDRGKSQRVLEFSDDGFIMTMTHEKTDLVAVRHFKRA
ncbi:sodium/calcium exchanger regulatory protein 1-like [Daphnia pulex]|uniref:sodium/calcium exchanger regulatory protein 1-like n=1 Tax=Daphnia pulex TaxID=6669 RepID=UPI001EDFB491|nr:sodium/calcium exchanger regulatory protein 1-like [Daphnia pulex]XP_046631448.1 sodium/calcium exchanger regulatory protein 1-like [Daphnia pulicaria]